MISFKEYILENIKGWKNAHSDLMKHRAAKNKSVTLVSLKKDGNESQMSTAIKQFTSETEALEHHSRVTNLNPTMNIRHNLYVDGVLKSTLGKDK
jgi:hypothetical protein